MDNVAAYDATYAFTHLLRTLQAATPPGQKFDATTAIAGVLTSVAAGGSVPAPSAASILGPSQAPAPAVAQTYQVEKPKGKGKDDKR